jgi:hypothetical protein
MKILWVILLLGFITSCANPVKKQVQIEKDQVTLTAKQKTILDRAHKDILDSPDIDPEVKDDFIALQYETYTKVQELNLELRKLKVVFFNSITKENHDQKKSNELIRQMKKLHGKKLDLMVDAFYQAKNILGHTPEIIPDHIIWIDDHDPNARY